MGEGSVKQTLKKDWEYCILIRKTKSRGDGEFRESI
jgi:hypothetical protein